MNLEIHVIDRHDVLIVQMRGDASNIEAEHHTFDTLRQLQTKKPMLVVVDMADLMFIASGAIGELVNFWTSLKNNSSKLYLAGANARIEDVILKTRLSELFPLEANVQSAMDRYKTEEGSQAAR